MLWSLRTYSSRNGFGRWEGGGTNLRDLGFSASCSGVSDSEQRARMSARLASLVLLVMLTQLLIGTGSAGQAAL